MESRKNDPLSFGALILDAEGKVAFATGFGRDMVVQQQITERYRNEGRQRGMMALSGPPDLIASYRSNEDATLFFIQQASSKSTLFDFVATVDFAHTVLDYFLNNPYESVVVVDDQARIQYIPPVHERFFGIAHGDALGKKVTDVIENTNLHEVVRTGKAEIGKLQEMGGVTRVVARIPIIENGKTLGALGRVMFKGPETLVELSKEVTKLRSEVEFYRNELSGLKRQTSGLDKMVGDSDAMRQLKADIAKVAPLSVPVLIIGESGTGKELAAHAIHTLSPRCDNPMVFVNAAALPASLVESELFGYEAGAFTGAERKGRKGKFELADHSSLFFDEIGDMPAEVQVKLLRVLQDGIFERVGGDRPRHSDFRLISATNRNFQQMIANGEFRLDLYYRISGVTIRMPSLRERPEDIPELVRSFLTAFAQRHRTRVKGVDSRVYSYLKELPWPGNVRQLLHEVEKAAIFCDGPDITLDNFRLMSPELVEHHAPPVNEPQPEPTSGKIQDAIEDLEKAMIRSAMTKYKGNKKKVAEELGISRAYLYKKLSDEKPESA
ncbi:sigma-54 interaction domain-containing protein [Noviherbaspirillum sp. Root189]|uniref:sigma-54 interaction domain-containing protein n=1 Tax=Noviherbaspirillum sp. Root189 TaxID=1736487 RepID=UPI00070B9BBC|nr:sigma 54-interacting transcriptional regulator [Noviherbaspirillum sp. Root189]KRB70599.1 Fis family transcriptional regulator [Noviherbaspirillum sp. Root189]